MKNKLGKYWDLKTKIIKIVLMLFSTMTILNGSFNTILPFFIISISPPLVYGANKRAIQTIGNIPNI